MFTYAQGGSGASRSGEPFPVGNPVTKPQYDTAGQLRRPEGYRDWKFVGANYGMGYTAAAPDAKETPAFHNVYIQPEAFREFAATGRFPDKTVLVMEVYRPGTMLRSIEPVRFRIRSLGSKRP